MTSSLNWTTIIVSGISLCGVVVGVIFSARANKRTAGIASSANELNWLKHWRDEAEKAQIRLTQITERAAEAERRAVTAESRLADLEQRTAAASEAAEHQRAAAEGMAMWIWNVVDAAKDSQVNAAELRRRINGGPPALHVYARPEA